MLQGFPYKGVLFCYILTLSMISVLFVEAPPVQAQRCQVLDFTPNYPSSVNPAQSFQVNTSLDIACAQWRTWYMARIDLLDRASGNVLSSSIFEIGWKSEASGTVSNSATAPQTIGSWGLILMLYIFEGGDFIGSVNQAFDIQVGTTAATTQQTTSSSATSISTPSSTTVSESSTAAQSIESTTTSSPLILSPDYIVPAALIVVIIALVAVLVKMRKRNA